MALQTVASLGPLDGRAIAAAGAGPPPARFRLI